MSDLLLETVRFRDYKLRFRWGCMDCPSTIVSVFLHRTDEEVKNFKRNIKQICSNNHVTIPLKQCTFCNMVYKIEDDICVHCEPRARKKAELYIKREELEKELNHEKIEEYRENIINKITQIESELRLLA